MGRSFEVSPPINISYIESMPLVLEVLLKNNLSEQYPVFNGLKIGRKKGNVLVDDLKMSALHACIETDLKGDFFLVDLGSANGLIFEGRRVKNIKLSPGLTFQMGHTHFRVTEARDSDASEVSSPRSELGSTPLKQSGGQLSTPLSETQRRNRNQLSQILQRSTLTVKDRPATIKPFTPALRISILNGPQAHTQWTLSYGPRKVGAHALDLLIHDQNVPDVCFELQPTESGTLFTTTYPDQVLFNGKEKATEMVKDGDEITILNALTLKVHFANENDQ